MVLFLDHYLVSCWSEIWHAYVTSKSHSDILVVWVALSSQDGTFQSLVTLT